jgi:hypothetical protein
MVSSEDLEGEIRRYSCYLRRRHDPQKGYLSTIQWVRHLLERKIGGLSEEKERALRQMVLRIKKRGEERGEIEKKLIRVLRKRKGTTYPRWEIGWRFKPKRRKEAIPHIPNSARLEYAKEHTKLLQQMVFEPWLKQLPILTEDYTFSPPGSDKRFGIYPSSIDELKLPVESEPLFDDARKHVDKKLGDPFVLWDRIKEEIIEFSYAMHQFEKEFENIALKGRYIPSNLTKDEADILDLCEKRTPRECIREIAWFGKGTLAHLAGEVALKARILEAKIEKVRKVLEKYRHRVSPLPGECDYL